MSALNDISPKDIDGKLVRSKLVEMGARL
jgi:hypothetical protein